MCKVKEKYVIGFSPNGYVANKIVKDNYEARNGEFIAEIISYEDGWNNQSYIIKFNSEGEYINFNEWRFPCNIGIRTHYKGSYESTHMTFTCISPDGLETNVHFDENEYTSDPLCYFFSKLWITACKTLYEFDILKPNNFFRIESPTDKQLIQMLRSVAYLNKLVNSYKENENTNVHILSALKEEYQKRFQTLMQIVEKDINNGIPQNTDK